MADSLNDGEFWLPSEFLTDDDLLMDKENFNKNGLHTDFGPNPCFPREFPYDLGSDGSFGSHSALNSPVESVVGSTETESDEEDLLAGLTHRFPRSTLTQFQKLASAPRNFEKTWASSGSPKSILSAFGSWSGRSMVSSNESPTGPSLIPSPTASLLGKSNDSWNLIYQAAEQIARLKMNAEVGNRNRGLDSSRSHTPVLSSMAMKGPHSGFCNNQFLPHTLQQNSRYQQMGQDQLPKQHSCSVWGRQAKEGWFSQPQVLQNSGSPACFGVGDGIGIGAGGGGGGFAGSGRCVRPLGLPRSALPQNQCYQNHQQQRMGSGTRAVSLSGSAGTGMKRECAGTGVFLPRRYANTGTDSRKKPGSNALLPARVVQAVNTKFDDVNAYAQPQSHRRINGPLIPDYELLVAQRNALLVQQRSIRPEGAMNHEMHLPHEWTY